MLVAIPWIESKAVGDVEPFEAGGGAAWMCQQSGKHGAAIVVPAALGPQAFAPTVLIRFAH